MVRRIPRPDGLIVIPEAYKPLDRYCKVLAAGPGKRIPGEWWFVKQPDGSRQWEWFDGRLEPMRARSGDTVVLPGVGAEDLDGNIGKDFFITQEDIGFLIRAR